MKITYKEKRLYSPSHENNIWIMNENIKTKEDRYLAYMNFFFKENVVDQVTTLKAVMLINEHKDGAVIYALSPYDVQNFLHAKNNALEHIIGYEIEEIVICDETNFAFEAVDETCVVKRDIKIIKGKSFEELEDENNEFLASQVGQPYSRKF